MTLEEIKDKAVARVEADNPGYASFKAAKVYEHLMDGTLVTVTFQAKRTPITFTLEGR